MKFQCSKSEKKNTCYSYARKASLFVQKRCGFLSLSAKSYKSILCKCQCAYICTGVASVSFVSRENEMRASFIHIPTGETHKTTTIRAWVTRCIMYAKEYSAFVLNPDTASDRICLFFGVYIYIYTGSFYWEIYRKCARVCSESSILKNPIYARDQKLILRKNLIFREDYISCNNVFLRNSHSLIRKTYTFQNSIDSRDIIPNSFINPVLHLTDIEDTSRK